MIGISIYSVKKNILGNYKKNVMNRSPDVRECFEKNSLLIPLTSSPRGFPPPAKKVLLKRIVEFENQY